MNKKLTPLFVLSMVLILSLSACQAPFALPVTPTEAVRDTQEETLTQESTEMRFEATQAPPTLESTSEPTQATTEQAPLPEETAEPDQSHGPTGFPANISPLTGLPVEDPDLLKLPPALISVSNFPASARPQAGINASPWVFEMAIGEGMTRFLAMFYGQFPEAVSGQTEGQIGGGTGGAPDDGDEGSTGGAAAGIGPIRSGRLPYEGLRSIYSGFLVMASADKGVAQTLNETTSVFGSDSDDINSAQIDVNRLQSLAESRAQTYPGSNFSLEGLKFSPTPPEGGKTADRVWVFYSSLNQVQWRYDADLGAYVRYDIKTDGSGEFVMATDRITGEPVSRENVIVIFANHTYLAPTLIDIDLINMPPMRALLFRDGEMHEIHWTTQFGDYEQKTGLLRPMRFVDEAGNPIALKNGYTWVELVSAASYYVEAEMSDHPFYPIKESEGTGLWLVRYKGRY